MIAKFSEFDISESNRENLKLVLSSLKNANEDELNAIANILTNKLTWGNIQDLANIVHVKIEKS